MPATPQTESETKPVAVFWISLFGTHILRHRRDRVVHRLVGGLVGAMLHRHVRHRRTGTHHFHFPEARLANRQLHRTGIRELERQQRKRQTK